MIEKLLQIKALGKFADWSATGDLQFRKLTLIYGENGHGKSTITSVLRSLSTNDPKIVLERAKLSSTDPISISLRARGNSFEFKNKAWNNPCEKLLVFDSVFVEKNVFSGERIDPEHRRNLFQIVLGADSVALVEAKTSLDKEIAAKTKSIGEKGAEIDRLKPTTLRRESFIALTVPADVQAKIEAAKKRVASINESAAIAALKVPAKVTFGISDENAARSVLSTSLDDVSQEAVRSVTEHIASCMDVHGEKWIEQGLKYIPDGKDECPFCGQSLTGVELIEFYNAYFSKSYSDHCETITQTADAVSDAISDAQLLELRKAVDANVKCVAEWRKYLAEIKEPILDMEAIEKQVKSVRTSITSVFNKKRATPLAVITESEEFVAGFGALGEVATSIDDYNTDITAYATAAEALRAKSGKDNLLTAQAELDKLEGAVTRHKPAVIKLVAEYDQLVADKKDLTIKKDKAVEALDKKSNEVIAKYQTAINKTLERFGAEFRIVKLTKDYVGQVPNAKYAIQVDGREVGLDASVPGTPSFRCTLSAGDKTTLAFGFFLAMLSQCDITNSIVVIDDPISSLDYFREAHTCSAILDQLTRASQIVVLSHCPEFLCKLWKNTAKADVKTLEIHRTANGSSIREWEIASVSRSEYERNWWTLREFIDKGAPGNLEDIARCIRPLLEDYLRFKYPSSFKDDDWLGGQIEAIRNSDAGSVLAKAQPLLTELTELNDFTKAYHHGTTGRQAPPAPLTDTALKPFAKRAIDLIAAVEVPSLLATTTP